MSIVRSRIKMAIVTNSIVDRIPSRREPSGVNTKNKITNVTIIIVHRIPSTMKSLGIICYNWIIYNTGF